MSRQCSGQVNQVGNQMPGMPQQNGNLFHTQMHNLRGQINPSVMDSEVIRIRQIIREKIFQILKQKHPQPNEVNLKRCSDLSKRLEDGLFKSAATKEEYMNLGTLQMRLNAFIRTATLANRGPQHSPFVNIPTPVGTMIPTPGLPHNENANVMFSAAVDPTMMSASLGVSTSFPTPRSGTLSRGASFRAAEGSFCNGHQQSASSSMNSGRNNMIAAERPLSQMIPTPGFSENNNQMIVNLETSNNNGTISSVDSLVVSQQVPSRQPTGQNNRMLQNLGSGMRSLMQQQLQNGNSNSGFENMMNGSSSSNNSWTTSSFGPSSRAPVHMHDPLHQPASQGDSLRSGDLYNVGASVGSSMMNNQNVNQVRMSSTQSSQLASHMMPHLTEVEKSNFQSSLSPRENQSQSSMSQFQHQIPQQQQGTAYNQQSQPNELSRSSLKYKAVQSRLASEIGTHVKLENGIEHPNEGFLPQGSSGLYHSNGNLPQNNQLSLADGRSNDDTDRSLLAVQDDLKKIIVGHEDAQDINLSSEASNYEQIAAPGGIMDQSRLGGAGSSINNTHGERQFRNQLRWLLFLHHARWCSAPPGKCVESHCIIAQKLLHHLDTCKSITCSYPRCAHTRKLLTHQRTCRDLSCPVCVPFKKFVLSHKKVCTRQGLGGLNLSVNGSLKPCGAGEAESQKTIKPSEVVDSSENQPSVKRLKSELPSHTRLFENGTMPVPNVLQIKPEYQDVKGEMPCTSNHNSTEIKHNVSSLPNDEAVKLQKDNSGSKAEVVVQGSEEGSGKYVKSAIKGVSLIELFTPQQVQEHITGLRQWVGQTRAKVEKIQAMEYTMSENSCQLCAVEKLSFEPPPIYCSPCGARIKRNAMYYTASTGDTRLFFCIPCYNESRGDKVVVDGKAIPKGRMEKRKNNEEIEESWVQCDRCEAWQHQICALFNGRRNDGGQAEYACPNCYIEEVQQGKRQPLPQSAVLGAKDLPGTALSDHIELRLARQLKQERRERARSQGKSYHEVPGVEGVVVRVVSSVDKKLEVKPRFLEIFREENYPSEFPYKSKVVLLFQKIEGVEVCLYGMYVQEFGSECLPPSQRRVYLSYLDSVKYFRPDIRTVTGEALRTFVYHEILIGYLEYCKKRGFASCYIWACPPLKGEDYILYCHPEIQKTPKSDKLREWYLAMLRKASRENIVVELTNLYDHFFIQTGECKAKVTAARLPYFDGDYWPGAAEDMINQISQEEEDRKLNKKGLTKKMITKRALKASGHLDISSNVSKDVVLMHKLGESISPMKEDFIMVHLQHSCTHCCTLIVAGNRWVCEQCKKFQLCDRCYDEERRRDDRDRHPINHRDKHTLRKVEITNVPEDTKDNDDILESEFFDTRQAFLSLCQGNHYQYDTLRRAKHSSMMMLYHLHNPTAPAFVTTCNSCHLDIETGQGWRCETCPDYDVCNSCYLKNGPTSHPHKLTNHPSIGDRDAQNAEARQQRVVQLRKMLDLLVHASQCKSPACEYQHCRKVKGLFRHGINCKTRAAGGCGLCKRMWYLLQLHSRTCKESACRVPRCRDLNEHRRRLQEQSDSRRRAAVTEMMRQRAKEDAGNA